MDVSYLSALAGLAGAAIGGFTSFGSTWLTQKAQLHQQRLDTARKQREHVFVEFLNEASRLYGDALGNEKNDVLDLVKLFATASHLRMVCSAATVAAAERVVGTIVDTYRAPNRTLEQLRDYAASGGLDPMREVAEAFRDELSNFQGDVAIPRSNGVWRRLRGGRST